ncbi:hypothetical protein BSZ35_13300 [Salinibacter sp. 10B]|uniref:DsbA family protein n=1 Tax=Salinibacter sp. 10B TaxID=1923971 RepID=UPI000CF4DBC0|nr:thioredoxin domain-containing protein [Salinibacter sp. 10B]PQJ35450.1 hypothetical protein BSZ35_13300 [Salinibacter sp. 10B]
MKYILNKYFIFGLILPILIFAIYSYSFSNENIDKLNIGLYNRLKNNPLAYKYGDTRSKDEILLLTDYECDGCRTIHRWIWPTINKKIKNDKIDYYSLDAILPGHEGGLLAATFSYCLKRSSFHQAKYFRVSVFKNKLPLKRNDLLYNELNDLQQKFRNGRGSLQSCVQNNNGKVEQINQNTLKLISSLGIKSIPAILINRQKVKVKTSKEEMLEIINNKINK